MAVTAVGPPVSAGPPDYQLPGRWPAGRPPPLACWIARQRLPPVGQRGSKRRSPLMRPEQDNRADSREPVQPSTYHDDAFHE